MKLRTFTSPAFLGGVLALSLLVAACGGDDDDTEPTTEAGDPTATTAASNGSDGGDSCRPTPYLMSVRAADGDTLGFENAQFEVVSAKAVSLAGGAGYTIYLADYEIPDEEIGAFSAPEPADGQTLVTLFITTFNGGPDAEIVEAGTEIEFSPEFGVLTYRVVIQQGAEKYDSFAEARGTLTVTDVGESICGDVLYEDTMTDFGSVQNSLEGPFGAVVVAEY
jgi:hypothetical protein